MYQDGLLYIRYELTHRLGRTGARSPSRTSTGNLNLSKAPFFKRRFRKVSWPIEIPQFNACIISNIYRPTLTNPIINLVHIQVLDIRGKDPIKQLLIVLSMGGVKVDLEEYIRRSRPPCLGLTTTY